MSSRKKTVKEFCKCSWKQTSLRTINFLQPIILSVDMYSGICCRAELRTWMVVCSIWRKFLAFELSQEMWCMQHHRDTLIHGNMATQEDHTWRQVPEMYEVSNILEPQICILKILIYWTPGYFLCNSDRSLLRYQVATNNYIARTCFHTFWLKLIPISLFQGKKKKSYIYKTGERNRHWKERMDNGWVENLSIV